MTTSSTRAGSRSLRSSRAARGWAARSVACQPERRPPRRPTGVRTASTITALGMRGQFDAESDPVPDAVPVRPAHLARRGAVPDSLAMDLTFTPSRRPSAPRPGPGWRRTSPPSPCPRSTPPRASRPTGPGSARCSRTAGRSSAGRPSTAAATSGIFEWLVFEEEYYRARAPTRVSQNGIFLLAPTMLEYGTEAQKARYLPPMASGDEIWCQGWSEPDAGSDLAGIRAAARRATRRATAGCSTARRPGPAGAPSPTGASASSAPTPRPSATGG